MFVCKHSKALLHPCLSYKPEAASATLPPLNVAIQKPIHKAYNCRHLVCDYGSLGVVVVLGVGALVEMNVRRSV